MAIWVSYFSVVIESSDKKQLRVDELVGRGWGGRRWEVGVGEWG